MIFGLDMRFLGRKWQKKNSDGSKGNRISRIPEDLPRGSKPLFFTDGERTKPEGLAYPDAGEQRQERAIISRSKPSTGSGARIRENLEY